MTAGLVQDRTSSRQVFLDCWDKHSRNLPLQPLEEIIVAVILEHPEYHNYLEDPDALDREFLPDGGAVNPFLHMSMHITIHEQVLNNRPAGISAVFAKLMSQGKSKHEVEHRMMDCLGEALWWAQRHNTLPDESLYLECLQKLV